jgi:hypothetical protein
MGEETTLLGGQDTPSPEEAKARITQMETDPNHLLWRTGPGHKEAVEERTRLYAAAYPSDPAAKDMLPPQRGLYTALKDAGITEDVLEQKADDVAVQAVSQAQDRAMEALRGRFGADADRVKADAQAIVDAYCTPADREFLDESGLGNDPEVLGLLADLAKHVRRGQEKGRKGRR